MEEQQAKQLGRPGDDGDVRWRLVPSSGGRTGGRDASTAPMPMLLPPPTTTTTTTSPPLALALLPSNPPNPLSSALTPLLLLLATSRVLRPSGDVVAAAAAAARRRRGERRQQQRHREAVELRGGGVLGRAVRRGGRRAVRLVPALRRAPPLRPPLRPAGVTAPHDWMRLRSYARDSTSSSLLPSLLLPPSLYIYRSLPASGICRTCLLQ